MEKDQESSDVSNLSIFNNHHVHQSHMFLNWHVKCSFTNLTTLYLSLAVKQKISSVTWMGCFIRNSIQVHTTAA
jgi:hypothetical protein